MQVALGKTSFHSLNGRLVVKITGLRSGGLPETRNAATAGAAEDQRRNGHRSKGNGAGWRRWVKNISYWPRLPKKLGRKQMFSAHRKTCIVFGPLPRQAG